MQTFEIFYNSFGPKKKGKKKGTRVEKKNAQPLPSPPPPLIKTYSDEGVSVEKEILEPPAIIKLSFLTLSAFYSLPHRRNRMVEAKNEWAFI